MKINKSLLAFTWLVIIAGWALILVSGAYLWFKIIAILVWFVVGTVLHGYVERQP